MVRLRLFPLLEEALEFRGGSQDAPTHVCRQGGLLGGRGLAQHALEQGAVHLGPPLLAEHVWGTLVMQTSLCGLGSYALDPEAAQLWGQEEVSCAQEGAAPEGQELSGGARGGQVKDFLLRF